MSPSLYIIQLCHYAQNYYLKTQPVVARTLHSPGPLAKQRPAFRLRTGHNQKRTSACNSPHFSLKYGKSTFIVLFLAATLRAQNGYYCKISHPAAYFSGYYGSSCAPRGQVSRFLRNDQNHCLKMVQQRIKNDRKHQIENRENGMH